MTLRLTLSGIGPPYSKQQQILDWLFRPAPEEVKQVDLCCGRGFGKTVFGCYTALRALTRANGQVGLFLEPDWSSLNSIFLDTWRSIVPAELWTENKGERKIELINGSVLYYGPRAVTGASDAIRDKYRGRNLHFVIDDEAAVGCDLEQYTNTLAAIRRPGDVRFYFTLSTPRVGIYKQLVTSPGHRLFRGSSNDNPYLPRAYVETLRSQMGVDQARREIEGEFVALEGRIWKSADLTRPWPDGNLDTIHTGFDKGQPWFLACDIGSATGAYVVLQKRDTRGLFPGAVWVAVADLCPRVDASAARAFQILKEQFGIPAAISAGADVHTANSADGRTVAYFANQIFGYSPRLYPCDEHLFNKQIQYDRLSYLVCSALNHRRFTVAKNFISLDTESRRGVREMLEEDVWPDEKHRRPSDFLPKGKDNQVQHTRDALMMCAASILSPPDWAPKKEYAA